MAAMVPFVVDPYADERNPTTVSSAETEHAATGTALDYSTT